jgi:D-alanine--poly(phosphoribitol) ligase subunit 2
MEELIMEDKVLDILEKICGVSDVREDRDIDLFDNGLLDSLALIELIISIEEEIGLKIEPTEISREDFTTPNEIIGYLTKRLV